MNKKTKKVIEQFTFDISNAVIPENWDNIPKQINIQTGQHELEYDIVDVNSDWYKELIELTVNRYRYFDSNKPIGLNTRNMFAGSHIIDSSGNVLFSGRDIEQYLADKKTKEDALENQLIPLRTKYPGIKDEYLIEFNDKSIILLKVYRPFTHDQTISDVFIDIFSSGGGTTYSDGTCAFIGAYNSLIDFPCLKHTINMFTHEEKVMLKEVFLEMKYLSPIYSLIHGQIDV